MNINICTPFYYFKAKYLFLNLKKKYIRKPKELKDSNKFCTSADAVTKAEKAFRSYGFLSWLDEFTQVRERRSNLPLRKSNTPSVEDEEKGLEKKEKNADDYSIQTENSALTKVLTIYQKLKKLKRIRQKIAEKENCYRLQQKRAILMKKSFF